MNKKRTLADVTYEKILDMAKKGKLKKFRAGMEKYLKLTFETNEDFAIWVTEAFWNDLCTINYFLTLISAYHLGRCVEQIWWNKVFGSMKILPNKEHPGKTVQTMKELIATERKNGKKLVDYTLIWK